MVTFQTKHIHLREETQIRKCFEPMPKAVGGYYVRLKVPAL
jgi:hypothetical protein